MGVSIGHQSGNGRAAIRRDIKDIYDRRGRHALGALPIGADPTHKVDLSFERSKHQIAPLAEQHVIRPARDLAGCHAPVERRPPDVRFAIAASRREGDLPFVPQDCKVEDREDKLLTVNPAVDLDRRRKTPDHADAREHCWSGAEARSVIDAAKTASPQLAAFVFLALDSGARKGELFGLGWEHLDLETGVLTITRQLDKPGEVPVFGPTKTKRTRTLTLRYRNRRAVAHAQGDAGRVENGEPHGVCRPRVDLREAARRPADAPRETRAATRHVERRPVPATREAGQGKADQISRRAAHVQNAVTAGGRAAARGGAATGALRDGADENLRARDAGSAAGRRQSARGGAAWLGLLTKLLTAHRKTPYSLAASHVVLFAGELKTPTKRGNTRRPATSRHDSPLRCS